MWNIDVAKPTLLHSTSFLLAETERNPKRVVISHSLEFVLTARNQRAKLEVDDPSFQPNHCGLRSIIGTQF